MQLAVYNDNRNGEKKKFARTNEAKSLSAKVEQIEINTQTQHTIRELC